MRKRQKEETGENDVRTSSYFWMTPFGSSAPDAAADGVDAALRPALVARPCGKRPRLELTTPDIWRQRISHWLDSVSTAVASTETSLEGFSREHVLFEAYRVLRDCWLFRGRSQDTFEHARSLPKPTQRLLITYAGYRLTDDGQYLVLQNEERKPYVGLLLVVLQRLLTGHGCHNEMQLTPFWLHGLRSSLEDHHVRVVTLSCCCFKRLNDHHTGDDSACLGDLKCGRDWLLAVETTLREIMGSTKGTNVVLLGGCMLTETGVALLASHLPADCFTVGDCYGRGVACVVFGADTWISTPVAAAATQGAFQADCSLARPVSCGCYTTKGMCAQAVLLSPMGPLIVHVQHSLRGVGRHEDGNGGGSVNCRNGSEFDLEEAHLWEWLCTLLRAPQPTVIVEWGDGDLSVVDSVFSRQKGVNENAVVGGGGGWDPQDYCRVSLGSDGGERGGVSGGLPLVYVRDASMTIERAAGEPPAGCDVCRVWRLRT